jgi:hypothetical protein
MNEIPQRLVNWATPPNVNITPAAKLSMLSIGISSSWFLVD